MARRGKRGAAASQAFYPAQPGNARHDAIMASIRRENRDDPRQLRVPTVHLRSVTKNKLLASLLDASQLMT